MIRRMPAGPRRHDEPSSRACCLLCISSVGAGGLLNAATLRYLTAGYSEKVTAVDPLLSLRCLLALHYQFKACITLLVSQQVCHLQLDCPWMRGLSRNRPRKILPIDL